MKRRKAKKLFVSPLDKEVLLSVFGKREEPKKKPSNKQVITGGRGAGKTSEIVKKCLLNDWYLQCRNREYERQLKQRYPGLKTFVHHKDLLGVTVNGKKPKVAIDNLVDYVQSIIGYEVVNLTIDTDLNDLNYVMQNKRTKK